MISLLPFAFAAGVLTVAAPCLLPVLPGILGGSLGQSKWRPLGIVAGLVVTFTIFGTAFAIFLDVLGISKGTLRIVSIGLLFAFGLALAVPTLYKWIVVNGTLLWRRLHRVAQNSSLSTENTSRSPGFWGAFGIGATLGVVWTPCAGPIFGAILTLAANTQSVIKSGILFFVYALGAGIPMLLIGYGGRALVLRIKGLSHTSARIRQVSGVILIIWAVALFFGIDRYIQANLVPLLPSPRL